MFPIIASSAVIAISYSLVFATFPKWMPNYQVINLSLMEVSLMSFFWSGEISLVIKAGVTVDNWLFVGTELHASHVDAFYPDWNGKLQYVADLMIIDSNSTCMNNQQDKERRKSDENGKSWNKSIQKKGENENISHPKHLDNTTLTSKVTPTKDVDSSTQSQREMKQSPYLTFPPRQVTYKHDNIVRISNLAPGTYLNGLKQALNNRGIINAGSIAVLQIKTTNLPLTIEMSCNHAIHFLSYPIKIVKQYCELENIAGGWRDLDKRGKILRGKVQKRFEESGSMFRRNYDNSPFL